jgi:hypothetical protein
VEGALADGRMGHLSEEGGAVDAVRPLFERPAQDREG